MTITVKHIISLDPATTQVIKNLTDALNGDTDKRIGELADKVKETNDKLEEAVRKNTPGSNS